MKFSEFPYERPDLDKTLAYVEELKERLQNAKNYDEFFAAFQDYDKALKHLDTQANLAYTRYTINTKDPFYVKERDWFDEVSPKISSAQTELVKVIMDSPYREELEKVVPRTWFLKNEFDMKTIAPQIIEDMQEENKAASDYQKLIASAQIEFDGKTYTLAGLDEKMSSPDRSVRERAHKAYWNWFAEHEKEIGDIYDRLVKIRTRIAKKMGYDTYVPFGYMRMQRMDYDRDDVEVYRQNVLKDIVPVAMDLYADQAKRFGYEGSQLPVWDEKVEFESGNPKPIHDEKGIVKEVQKMFEEMDPETGRFFDTMVDQELLDLASRPGKAAGGYCTGIPDYKVPFIFANFAGTQGDIETLTHESGHAFQAWSSMDIFPAECVWPTMESAEIDSMSMEFFAWPWMKNLFGDKAEKYYYSHLAGAVKFIPYGVLVDHFQHEVYDHPEWTNDERMACWRELEKKYLPQKDYSEIDFLERGGWWMRQLHIFLDPFYYIDYTLAQAAALQFWSRMMKKDPQAFEDYKKLCRAGGTKPFRELIELANLKVPFEDGCLAETMDEVREWYKDNKDLVKE